MIVQTKVLGAGAGLDEHAVDVPADELALRELITLLVQHELAEYEQRREAVRTLRILTPADLATGAGTGSYGRERRAVPTAPPFEQARARALEAFEDELYFVFFDGRRIDDLDTLLEITPESTLRLVRVVALAGG